MALDLPSAFPLPLEMPRLLGDKYSFSQCPQGSYK